MSTARLRSVSLFSSQAGAILKEPLHLRVSSQKEDPKGSWSGDVTSEVLEEMDEESRGFSGCLSCHVTFDLRSEQVAHYKLDWHRYNLKRKLRGLPHMTQEVFEVEAGDLSSISGSESDSEGSEVAVQPDPAPQSSSPFIHFTSGDSQTVYSVYRATLTSGKESTSLLPSLLSLSHPPLWAVLMHSGGHFAGAVFRGPDVLVHKTFHRYTVRAKRGTSQSVRDNQSGGHGPRSAGATLRRYNEAALEREVQELLASWSTHLKEANAIFVRTPKTHQSMFSGGRTPSLLKDDHRIRGIPFVTRRPTLKEVKRVHSCLASIYIGGVAKSVDSETTVPVVTVTKVAKTVDATPPSNLNCAGSKEGGEDSGVGEGGEGEGKRKKTKKKKKMKVDKVVTECQEKAVDQSPSPVPPAPAVSPPPALGQLLGLCKEGGRDEEVLTLLQNLGLCRVYPSGPDTEQDCAHEAGYTAGSGQSEVSGQGNPLNVLYGGVSPLHVASEYGHTEIVGLLLHYGANPTLRNCAGHLPYLVAKDKPTRDCFRRFMAQQPTAYDYAAAQIPSPLTEEMERERRDKAAEKKREKRRHTKKKKAEEKNRREEEEVQRNQKVAVAELSEREKRALAAEKRLAHQFSQDSSVQRAGICSWCGCGLTGLVPFHRLQYQYCSMPCVRQHRTQLDGH